MKKLLGILILMLTVALGGQTTQGPTVIKGTSPTIPTLVVTAAPSQSVDSLDVNDSSGNHTMTVNPVTGVSFSIMHLNGDASPTPFGVAGGGTMSPLANTKSISVSATGSGSTTWTYNAEELVGGISLGADIPSSAINAATLTGSVYNTLTAVCNARNDTVQFHRTAGGLSAGVIGTPQSCATGTATLLDTGLAASSAQLGEPFNESGMAIQSYIWLKAAGAHAQLRVGGTGASIQLPDFFSSCTAAFGCASGGIAFGDNNSISFGWLNANGTIATPMLIFGATNSTHVYANIPTGTCGLGFGGASYQGNMAVFPSTYVGPGGTNENSVLFSEEGNSSCGADNNPIFVGPIQGFATSLGDTNVVAQTSSRTNVGLCRSSQTACTDPALYSATFYVEDAGSCTTAGSAAVTLSITYADETGTHTIPIVLHQSDGSSAVAFPLGTGNRQGSGQVVLWSTVTGGVTPGWSSVLTACSSGTAKYTVHASVTRLN